MPKTDVPKDESGRTNQRRRTRKDILAAAGRLLKAGKALGMDEVAAEAQISRATVYRYFPNIDSLLVEAPLEGLVPSPDQVFAGDTSSDPFKRIDKAEAVLHEVVYRNEAQLRKMLAASLESAAKGVGADGTPVRQNRRSGLIEAALAPSREQFSDAAYSKLVASLSLIFGTESMIVFRDVLSLDEKTARKVKCWATKTLVQAAIEESKSKEPKSREPKPRR